MFKSETTGTQHWADTSCFAHRFWIHFFMKSNKLVWTEPVNYVQQEKVYFTSSIVASVLAHVGEAGAYSLAATYH